MAFVGVLGLPLFSTTFAGVGDDWRVWRRSFDRMSSGSSASTSGSTCVGMMNCVPNMFSGRREGVDALSVGAPNGTCSLPDDAFAFRGVSGSS